MSSVAAFDLVVEFRRSRRQDKEPQALAATGILELCGRLTATIDLDGPQGEGRLLLKCLEELRAGLQLAE